MKNIDLGNSFEKLKTIIMNEEQIMGPDILIFDEARKQIKARELVYKLKTLPYIHNVSESWKSLTDRQIVGATVQAPSLIRTRLTIERLKEDGWEVEDKWPASTNIYIKFKLD